MGVAYIGGLGAFVGPPVISALIANLGWREAALILGLVALVIILLAQAEASGSKHFRVFRGDKLSVIHQDKLV